MTDRQTHITPVPQLDSDQEKYSTDMGVWLEQYQRNVDTDLNWTRNILGTQVYDVRDYGAVGDGVTDDTTAIQSAIDAAELSGGIVFFSAATYLLNSSVGVVVDSSNVLLVGVGQSTIIKQGSSFSGTYLITLGQATPSHTADNHIEDCGIEKLRVLGIQTDTPSSALDNVNGILVTGIWKATLRDVTVERFENGFTVDDPNYADWQSTSTASAPTRTWGAWWTTFVNCRAEQCRSSDNVGHGFWLKTNANETTVIGGESHKCNCALEMGNWGATSVVQLPGNVTVVGLAMEATGSYPWTYDLGGAYTGPYGLVIHAKRPTLVGCRYEDTLNIDMVLGKYTTGVEILNIFKNDGNDIIYHADFAGFSRTTSDNSFDEIRGDGAHLSGKSIVNTSNLTVLATKQTSGGTDDTNARFVQDTNGLMLWGSGAAGGDTNLYRSDANELKTDDHFISGSGATINGAAGLVVAATFVRTFRTFTAADKTPDVSGGDLWITNGEPAGVPTGITDFNGGTAGQIITIVGGGAGNTTIRTATSANMKMNAVAGGDAVLAQYDTIQFIRQNNNWLEICRSIGNV